MDIKRFLEETRISQRELAEVFNCNPANVSNIVRGKRNLTPLHLRLLIERYGFDLIARYADPSELPSSGPVVTIDMSKGHTEITGNSGPVNNGSGTQTTVEPSIVDVMNKQANNMASLIEQNKELIAQQNRLIALLETSLNK